MAQLFSLNSAIQVGAQDLVKLPLQLMLTLVVLWLRLVTQHLLKSLMMPLFLVIISTARGTVMLQSSACWLSSPNLFRNSKQSRKSFLQMLFVTAKQSLSLI
jgi:hypothetical protein